jgi:hypothetical protein
VNDNLPDRAEQRASDADRDRVIEVLQAAAADGRLDLDEFNDRMSAASKAKTFGELEPLTADLRGVASGDSPSNELVIQVVGSSTRRSGKWVVPRRVVVKGTMGSPVLDFTEAQLQSREVDVALDVSMGTTVLVVPDGTAVDASDLLTKFGGTKIKVKEADNPPLKIRLTGETNFGSVVVRRRRFFDRRHSR